jgi:hypothetical protein
LRVSSLTVTVHTLPCCLSCSYRTDICVTVWLRVHIFLRYKYLIWCAPEQNPIAGAYGAAQAPPRAPHVPRHGRARQEANVIVNCSTRLSTKQKEPERSTAAYCKHPLQLVPQGTQTDRSGAINETGSEAGGTPRHAMAQIPNNDPGARAACQMPVPSKSNTTRKKTEETNRTVLAFIQSVCVSAVTLPAAGPPLCSSACGFHVF